MVKKLLGILSAVILFGAANSYASDMTKVTLNKPGKVINYTLKVNNDRTVVLKGPITAASVAPIISAIKGMNELTHQDIFIIINSPGGSVVDGLELIDTIKALESRVYCAIESEAYSMAAILSQFCYRTLIHKHAAIMFHEASYQVPYDSAARIFELVQFVTKYLGDLDKDVAHQMGISTHSYQYMAKKNWWLTATDAAKYGVVDGVINELYYTAEPFPAQTRGIFFFSSDEKDGNTITNPLRKYNVQN